LLEVAKDDRLGPLVVISLYVALRPGEVAGLTWSAVNLDAGQLVVHQQRRREPDGTLTMSDPKAKSGRRLTMPPALVDYLRLHKKRQTAERLRSRPGVWDDNDLVVCTRTGALLDPSNCRRAVAVFCKDAGIFQHVTPNDLRRTAATLSAHSGVPLEELRYVMGHKDERMLRDFYVKAPPVVEAGQLQAVLGAV
jgi:integrase